MSASSTASAEMIKWRDKQGDLSLLDETVNAGSFMEKYDQSPCPEYLRNSSTGDISFLAKKFQSLKLKGSNNEIELNFDKDTTGEELDSLIVFEEPEKVESSSTLQPRASKISNIDVLSPEPNIKILSKRSSVYFRFDPLYETPSSDLNNNNTHNADDSGKSTIEPSIESIKTLDVGKKCYTEEQVKEILRKHKEAAEEKFLEECKKKTATEEQPVHFELLKMLKLFQVYKKVSEEMINKTEVLKTKVKCLQEINNIKQIENEKIREEIAAEVQSYEELSKSFEELFSRHNQSKSMTKSYQDNQESLVKQLEHLKKALEEQEKEMAELEVKQDAMNKSHLTELAKLKTSEEKEDAILNAKLQRSEITVTRLENSINELKIQNEELSTLYDELVRKAGKS